MKLSEQAWVVEQWLSGMRQREIADLYGQSTSSSNIAIVSFCSNYGERIKGTTYDGARREIAWRCLEKFKARGGLPLQPMHARGDGFKLIPTAKMEHAFLLKCEGLSNEELCERLDVGRARVYQMIEQFKLRMKRAMRRTKFRIEEHADVGE